MVGDDRPFSHVGNITDYMRIIAGLIGTAEKKRILDIPAGSGKFSDILRQAGHEVVSADINRERSDFVYADMSSKLPFADNEFDTVVCMEGVEHVVNPVQLLEELVRVCKNGGEVIISKPNVMSMYSRLHFLFTGVHYQFSPAELPGARDIVDTDRGHISPLTYFQLRYLLEYYGCRVIDVKGDRFKKKALLPLYLPLIVIGWIWGKRIFFGKNAAKYRERSREMLGHVFSAPLLLSRSVIVVSRKL